MLAQWPRRRSRSSLGPVRASKEKIDSGQGRRDPRPDRAGRPRWTACARHRAGDRSGHRAAARSSAKVFSQLPMRSRSPEDAILASNTSSISITVLGANDQVASDRVIGMHFMNPVPLMVLVEVIRGQDTSDRHHQMRVMDLRQRRSARHRSRPTDYPGFISNRDVAAHDQRGRLYCLMEGVSTREGIDSDHEAGNEPPDGPAHPGGLHRPRRLCGDSRRPEERSRRR